MFVIGLQQLLSFSAAKPCVTTWFTIKMRSTFYIAAALVLLSIAIAPVCGNESHFGVDDWTADDIAKHLKQDVKIDVPATAIAALGLQGSTLFDVADTDLTSLGLKPSALAAVKRSLVQVLHRVNAKPVDFWEWRTANRRLFDAWIQPLMNCPRALLIWARFFDANEAIEHINDEIDETHPVVFFLQWVFVPSYPIYQVVRKASDAHSYIDELAMFIYGAGVLGEVVTSLWVLFVMKNCFGGKNSTAVMFSIRVFARNQSVFVGATFFCAVFSYYILWWVVPLFLTTTVFYLQFYIILPVAVVGPLVFPGLFVNLSTIIMSATSFLCFLIIEDFALQRGRQFKQWLKRKLN